MLLFYLSTIIIIIPVSLVYAQEFKEYESELLGIKLKYPYDWDKIVKEERSTTSDNNHRSITFDLGGENVLKIYVHDTDQEVKSLNELMLHDMNLMTSTGYFAVKFIELSQNSTLAGFQAVKIVNDQSFMLGNDHTLSTVMAILALSDDDTQTYGVTYKTKKVNFGEYLKTVEKIIESIETVNK